MRTEVGYAGGQSPSPTYRDLGGHAEVLTVTFRPDLVPVDALLDRFWQGHDPGAPRRSSQYRALLLVGEHQRAAVEASVARARQRLSGPVQTEILYGAPCHRAEDYHQKWYLRRHEEMFDELRRLYPDERALLRSTVAARVNGYVHGHGTAAQLEAEIGRLGLSAAGQQRLRRLVRPAAHVE